MCEMELGEVGGAGKVGEVILAKHAKHDFLLLPRQFFVLSLLQCLQVQYSFLAKMATDSENYSKSSESDVETIRHRFVCKGDAGVCIFEDGEAFIQICEKGGDVE